MLLQSDIEQSKWYKRYKQDSKETPLTDRWLRGLARTIAHAIRNSELENLHAGIFPDSKKDDYPDMKILTPNGKIPWVEGSRISDKEMRLLMLIFEQKIEGILNLMSQWGLLNLTEDRLEILEKIEKVFFQDGVSWDNPRKEIK